MPFRFLLGSHIKALFGEVLGSTGMIGHRGDGGTELGGQLAVLGVAADQVSGIVEDIGGESIDGVLGHIVAG